MNGQNYPSKEPGKNLLDGYRALDLTTDIGFATGCMLGKYGVDVIKIERPGGDPSRIKAPYIGGKKDPEKSIFWNVYNADKRGITLDITTEKGKEIFLEMVKTADFVLESFEPGYLDELGLGYDVLSKVNPAVVLTSITPFGQFGPKAHWKGGDLIAAARGAVMDNIGDEDRCPLLEPADTSIFYGNCAAFCGTMVAHYARVQTGEGQQVDISLQEAGVSRNPQGQIAWMYNRNIIKRMGAFNKYGTTKVRTIWECKDGFINWTMFAGFLGAKSNAALSQWMTEDGMENPLAEVTDWVNFSMAPLSAEQLAHWEDCIAKFFKTHTKDEYRVESPKRKLNATVLDEASDLYQNYQLNEIGYWKQIEYPEWGVSVPHVRYITSASETVNETERRAPHVGEHNEEILGKEFGYNVAELKAAGII